jgi:hypothetical protein
MALPGRAVNVGRCPVMEVNRNNRGRFYEVRIEAYLGHKNIRHTVKFTELPPDRFRNFWRD